MSTSCLRMNLGEPPGRYKRHAQARREFRDFPVLAAMSAPGATPARPRSPAPAPVGTCRHRRRRSGQRRMIGCPGTETSYRDALRGSSTASTRAFSAESSALPQSTVRPLRSRSEMVSTVRTST